MKEKKHNNLKKAQLFIVISLLTLSVLFMFKGTGITGHFSADFKSQVLDMEIGQSQKYLLSTNNNEPIYLSSFRLSGEVVGDGSVEVFIDNTAGQRVLIYNNVKAKEEGLPAITGMAVAAGGDYDGEEEGSSETLMLLKPLGEMEWRKPGLALAAEEEYAEGTFNNKCVDTCFIEMPLSNDNAYELIFNIEPGTRLKLTKITYTLKDENI